MFSFLMYDHEKLDLKFVHSRAKIEIGSNKICPRKVYTSEDEIAEENSRTTSFGEKGLFSCVHIYFGTAIATANKHSLSRSHAK